MQRARFRIGPWLPCAVAGCLLLGACSEGGAPAPLRVVGGDPANGKAVVEAIGCGACHMIPGVRGANGIVGPALNGFGQRQFIGGIVPNRPENLSQWVRDAPSLAPATAMPALPISANDARDVAAFLYRLR